MEPAGEIGFGPKELEPDLHGWPDWVRNYQPIGWWEKNYVPRVTVVKPSLEIPTWALFAGLGLLVVVAFGGRR